MSFVFKLLYIVFWFWVSSSYFYDKKGISVPLQILAADSHRDKQLIAHRIWEGGGNRLIDRYVLHLMSSVVDCTVFDLHNKYSE